MIADNQGRIRWFHQLVNPLEATDFRAQTYEGKPVLTWWEGGISKAGVGVGRGVDLRRHVHQDRHRQGGRRPGRRPARVPADAARHGVHQRLPRGPGRPDLGRRAEERLGLRQRRAGDRRLERRRRLRVAQPRPRAAGGVDAGESRACEERDEEAPARLLPRQLGRGRAGRQHPDLRLATRARSICWHATGTSSGASAARRATSARRRRSSSRSSTTRGCTTATCSRSSTTARSRRSSRTRGRSSSSSTWQASARRS